MNSSFRKAVKIMGVLVAVTCSSIFVEKTPIHAAVVEPVVTKTDARNIDFNDDWKFKLNVSGQGAPSEVDYDDADWQALSLPHDWSIFFDFDHNSPAQNEGGLLNGGVGWYRKSFRFDKRLDKNVRINFAGVYMDSTVYVNGKVVGNYPNGYTPFSYDITPFLNQEGINTIAVKVVNKQPSSRWYSGSGIYRDVSLTFTDNVSVKEYGTTILTPTLDKEVGGEVTTQVKTTVLNKSNVAETLKVKTEVLTVDGTSMGSSVSDVVTVQPGLEETLETHVMVSNPTLWDLDTPVTYRLKTQVYKNNQIVDETLERFGYRFMNWTPNGGFSLNGKDVKFYGVSMHHDQGALGSVANYDAMRRQMEILKDMGVNSVRITHNPADDKLLAIAEDLGLMIIDEAFDTWYGGKKPFDYGRFFEKEATHPEALKGQTWAEYDLKRMVARGKNSPAVIMWSLGNEIGESNSGDAKAVQTIRNLNRWTKEVDKTRYTTMGQDVYRWAPTGGHERVSAEVDAVGINYAEDSYKKIRANHPDWLIYGSETSSATRSRGVYAFPDELRSHDNSAQRKYQQSDYGNDHVGWGKTATNSWIPDRDEKGYAGQFIWTGFDYIGEPTPWHNQNQTPPKSSYFGIIDTAGFPKNDFYLYQSQWKDVETDPMVHILPHWNWEKESLLDYNMRTRDGKIPVRIFSNASKVELFLDDQSLGEKAFVKKTTAYGRPYQEGANAKELYLEWRLAFKPGTLKAVAKDDAGNVIAEDVVQTSNGSATVALVPEQRVIRNGRDHLAYIHANIVDEYGVMNPDAQNNITFTLEGNGEIVGVDNGDPASNERYKAQHDGSWQRKAFNGKALVIVKSDGQPGSFKLHAKAENLSEGQTEVYAIDTAPDVPTILGFDDVSVFTETHVQPQLPVTVNAIYSDGSMRPTEVQWEAIDAALLAQPGKFAVKGHVQGSEKTVQAMIMVRMITDLMEPILATPINIIPELPATISAFYSNGAEVNLPVTWEPITEAMVAKAGVIDLHGRVHASGQDYEIYAHITVLDRVAVQENIAIRRPQDTYPKATSSYMTGGDRIERINDGVIDFGNRWTNWVNNNGDKKQEWVMLEFEKVERMHRIGVHFFTDNATKLPESLMIETSMDGINFTPVSNQSKTHQFKVAQSDVKTEVSITFDAHEAKFIRLTMDAQMNGNTPRPMGLSELKVIGDTFKTEANQTATLDAIKLDDVDLEQFKGDQKAYVVTVPFGKTLPILNGVPGARSFVNVVQPSLDNNYQGRVRVTSEDGLDSIDYHVTYVVAEPVFDETRLTLDRLEGSTQETIKVTTQSFLEDGTLIAPSLVDVTYDIQGSVKDGIKIQSGNIYLHEAGTYTIKAKASYGGAIYESNTVTLIVKENEKVEPIKAFKPIVIRTNRSHEIELPKTVTAQYGTLFDREVPVTWKAFDQALLDQYGTFEVKGKVQGTEIEAIAKVIVEGYLGVEQFSLVTPQDKSFTLPLKAKAYHNTGRIDEFNIEWESFDAEHLRTPGTYTLKGMVETANAVTTLTVRVSGEYQKGDNIAKMWTGSELPAAIASFTNDGSGSNDRINAINDAVISYTNTPANRWTNWQTQSRESDWVGIIFADAGTMSTRFVDNLVLGFFEDDGTGYPESYKVEVLKAGIKPELPTKFGHISREDSVLNDPNNWVEVTNLKASSFAYETMNELTFDGVETYAIRINMTKQKHKKGLGITELEIYDRIAKANDDFDVSLQIAGKAVTAFESTTDYIHELKSNDIPQIKLEVSNNASVTQVPTENGINFIVKAEDGIKTKTYTVSFDAKIKDARNTLIKAIDQAKNIEIERYEGKGVKAMQSEIIKAQKAVADLDHDADALMNFVESLTSKINDLVALEVNVGQGRKDLQALIEIAHSIDRILYTEESLDHFDKQLTFATATYNDETSSIAVINHVIKNLREAIFSLEYRDQSVKGPLDTIVMNSSLQLDLSEVVTEADFIQALNIQNPDNIPYEIKTNFMDIVDPNTTGTYGVTVRLTQLSRMRTMMRSNPYIKEFKVDVVVVNPTVEPGTPGKPDVPTDLEPTEIVPNETITHEKPTITPTAETPLPAAGVSTRNVTALIILGAMMCLVGLKKSDKKRK